MEPEKDEDTLLREHRTRLQSLREQGTTASPSEPGSSEIVSSAQDGTVRVRFRERRLVQVDVAPGLIEQPRPAASEALRTAINDGMARSLAQSPRAGDPGPNLGALSDQISDFARQSGEHLRRIQGAVEQNMAKLAKNSDVRLQGDASPQYVDFLFDDALKVVQSMQLALAGGTAEPVHGEGCDEAQEITAVVCDGVLTELSLTGFALQMPHRELGAVVSEVVNDAVDEWETHAAAAANQGVDVDALRELGERADSIRAQSMQHLRSYTDSMTSIMRDSD